MATKLKEAIPITIYLTPEQIEQAYLQIKRRKRDWMNNKRVLNLLEKLAEEAEKELKQGNTVSLKELKAELGV